MRVCVCVSSSTIRVDSTNFPSLSSIAVDCYSKLHPVSTQS